MKKTNRTSESLVLKRNVLLNSIKKYWQLYVFLIPGIVGVIIFNYVPMYGVQLAFKKFVSGQAISDMPWVGLKHFRRFFSNPKSLQIIWNTLKISLVSQVVLFPLPLIFALSLNQVKHTGRKKLIQNITYIPHLFSIVVTMSMAIVLLAPKTGIINIIVERITGTPILFFGKDEYVIPIYCITGIWQGLGYGAVIYLSALSNIDQETIEAARIDGASRLQIIRHIELPALKDTIAIILILDCGRLFSVGTDKMLLIQTSLNLGASEVIGTYSYQVGLLDGNYAFSTAISLFNNLANVTLMLIVNGIVKKLTDNSII